MGERVAGTPSPFESSRNIRCYGTREFSSMTIGTLPWLVKVRTASIRGPRMIHSAYLGPFDTVMDNATSQIATRRNQRDSSKCRRLALGT